MREKRAPRQGRDTPWTGCRRLTRPRPWRPSSGWIRGADDDWFAIGLAILLGLAALFGLLAFGLSWFSGPLRRQRPVPMAVLTEGCRMVQGQALSPLLQALFTGLPCVW